MSTPLDQVNWPKGIGERLGDFVKLNQREIVVILGVIFVGLTCFALGRISAWPEKENVVFQPATIGGGEKTPRAESGTPTISTEETTSNPEEIKLIGSKTGKKYHWPWCSSAKKIKPENQVWFSSEKEAQAAGYTKCANFDKLAPAGYAAK